MTRTTEKLSAVMVDKTRKPGRYGDGRGLWLQVSKTRTKAWLFRYMLDGRARQMGLGPVDLVSLAEARDLAREQRKILLAGDDPIEARDRTREKAKLEAARALTFQQCAEAYIKAHRAGWRNAKHGEQWGSTLATYVYPTLGHLPVAAVDTALVLKVLEPVWTAKPETASRVRGRIEAVLDWAKARSYRKGDNPARWRGHLDKLLPAKAKVRKVRHHPALPHAELPGFMVELRTLDGVSPRALEFVILTATRTGEAIGATWPEIDVEARTWTIPGDRMKAGKEHKVPLSERAVELLQDLPREGEFVFPGGRAGAGLSNMALLATLKRMGRPDLTTHGFRSTFRDWAAERTSYPQHVAEMALAHAIGDKVEAAYRRGDLFEKRTRLMDEWARYCNGPAPAGEVVPMRGAAS